MIKKILFHVILPIIVFWWLTLSISHKILPNTWAIAHNDWSYYFNLDHKTEYINSVYTDDYFWKDISSTVFLRLIKWNTIKFLNSLWLNHNYSSYVMTFWMLFFSSLLYYFLFSSYTNRPLFGYMAWVFVIFNNFTIESLAFWWYFYYFAWLSVLWIAIYRILLIHDRKSVLRNDIVILSLSALLIILPMHLAMYSLLLWIYYVYSLIFSKMHHRYKILIAIIFIIGLHSYWIFPFLFSLVTNDAWSVYWWNLDAVLAWYKNIATYINIVQFRQYFNLISIFTNNFIWNSIFYYIVLLIFLLGLLKSFKSWKWNILLFLLITYLFFLNLSLWFNSALTWDLRLYFRNKFSVFHFFRSFTRFIIVIIPIFIATFIVLTNKSKYKVTIVSLFMVWNVLAHMNLFSWNLSWVIPAIDIPNEYELLNQTIWSDKLYRVLSLPNLSYESYTWSISDVKKMRQDYYFKEYYLNSPVLHDRTSLKLWNSNAEFEKIFKDWVNSDDFIETLSQNNIWYVIIHKDYLNILDWSIISSENVISYFEKLLNPILSNDFYDLYKIETASSLLNVTKNASIVYAKESSFSYSIDLSIPRSWNVELMFLNSFDSNWKLFPESKKTESCKNKHKYHNWAIKCLDETLFPIIKILRSLFKDDVLENVKYKDYANKRVFDYDMLPKSWKLNENIDSSWEVRVTFNLIYIKQWYFYIWLSVSVLFIIILFMLFLKFREKNDQEF